jgi:branched-chain amino acid transport system ATP-binding protein
VTSREPVIDVRGLHVRFGEVEAVSGVDLTAYAGHSTALLGRNGAGKTTTLLGILGLLEARGSVRFHGDELVGRRTHEVVQLGIGYVPENREVFARLSVLENLRLAERTPEARERYDLVYELFPELRERSSQRAGTLSGGQQQMLALGRALLNPNRLLLVDEPTEGLAPVVVQAVVEALRRVAAATPILLVEHNLRVARQLSSEVVVIAQGRVVHSGGALAFFDDELLTQRHLGVVAQTEVRK